MKMVVFPNAKINIGLRITGKRSDGYHDIETIFYPVRLSDAMEFVVPDEVISKDILNVTGIDTGSDTDNNLVIKALLRLRRSYTCLLYTSPSPRDRTRSRMPSSA